MSGTWTEAVRGLGTRVRIFGEMIRFSHSVFALPFALAGVLFAARARGGFPPAATWLWVIVAMVGARTAAMAMNRIVDLPYDRENPRTRERALPRGTLTPLAAGIFTALAVGAFVTACAFLNPLALALSPVALAIVFFYSYTKRFTWASHLFLGLSLAVAPVGGWVAVTGRLAGTPFLVAGGVLAWVAGFDVLYALQDLEFDRARGLRSIPARFGVKGALAAARGLHVAAVAFLAAAGRLLGLAPGYWIGLGVIAAVLVYEHSLVKADDLRRLDKAFFDMNAVVSVVYAVAAAFGVMG
jgi:4-hydroxybenzoate polyprenyltransferase